MGRNENRQETRRNQANFNEFLECFDRYDFDYICPKSSKFTSHFIASLSCGTPGTEFVGHSIRH
jgi:hypothetical protein